MNTEHENERQIDVPKDSVVVQARFANGHVAMIILPKDISPKEFRELCADTCVIMAINQIAAKAANELETRAADEKHAETVH